MKVALVYDRVNKWGGAERVLLALHNLFPKAPLFTAVYNKSTAQWADVFTIHPSFLQKISYARTHHEIFAPVMPLVFESFSFDAYDVVISVTSESAKG
ncbi:MAG TPA: glycosyltransferase family 4 protein, partial [Candidatus Levybacteria bacterium]|nr:glycosyltransferase family 4 protein [Candidatus Levybacteria bacterium]